MENETMDERDERDGEELIEAWRDQNRAHSFEGESGIAKLEQLCETLGYRNNGFRFGDPIQQFLCDNPGACDAIVEFITEWTDRNDEWRENIADSLEPEDDDEEDSEDEEV
jgi:hypothetical protein